MTPKKNLAAAWAPYPGQIIQFDSSGAVFSNSPISGSNGVPVMGAQALSGISASFFPSITISDNYAFITGPIAVSNDSSSESLENELNNSRLAQLQGEFSAQLKELLLHEEFEYGVENEADRLVSRYFKLNELATKSWLTSLFMENFKSGRAEIACGILHIIARQDETVMGSEGEVIALAAFTHRNPQIQECGIRVFESWGSTKSLKVLQQVKIETPWLREYLEKVVSDLSETHAIPSPKN